MTNDDIYVPPTITDLGSVEAVTAANRRNNFTDKTFPAGTPTPIITTS